MEYVYEYKDPFGSVGIADMVLALTSALESASEPVMVVVATESGYMPLAAVTYSESAF